MSMLCNEAFPMFGTFIHALYEDFKMSNKIWVQATILFLTGDMHLTGNLFWYILFVQNLLRAWKLWWDVHKQAELAHQLHSLGRQVGKMMPECTVSCSFSVLIATTRTDFMGKESLKHGVDMLYFISVWHMGQRLFCNPDMASCLSPLCVVNSAQIWLLSFP